MGEKEGGGGLLRLIAHRDRSGEEGGREPPKIDRNGRYARKNRTEERNRHSHCGHSGQVDANSPICCRNRSVHAMHRLRGEFHLVSFLHIDFFNLLPLYSILFFLPRMNFPVSDWN